MIFGKTQETKQSANVVNGESQESISVNTILGSQALSLVIKFEALSSPFSVNSPNPFL